MSIMNYLIIMLIFIVCINLINEKWIHLQNDIALIFFSLILSTVLLLVNAFLPGQPLSPILQKFSRFEFESYLIDTVLCFMLFAGASKVNLKKFRQNIKAISLLALLTTVASSVLYGTLFWVGAQLFGLPADIWICILLGCIVSPTDPIAATGILSKLNLSKNVTSVIESESLFNDGTGVTLIVFFKSIISHSGENNFVMIGLSILNISISTYIMVVLPTAIIAVILSRFMGVALSTLILGRSKIPSSYSLIEFVSLMTWSALKGGLSLALAMSMKEILNPDTYLIVLNTAYITVVFTVIVQGLTVKKGYLLIEQHKARRIRSQSIKCGTQVH